MTDAGCKWTTHDTIALKRFGSLDPSPDGKSLVFTVVQAVMVPEKSGYLAQIFLADDQGTSVEQLTNDERSSYDPQWSPDGKSIAYLWRGNIWLLDIKTRHVQQLTAISSGVSSYKWSPDGSRIAFTAPGELPPGVSAENNAARVVGQDARKLRLWVIMLANISNGPGMGQPVTGSDTHVGSPEVPGAYQWSPDGNSIVFCHCKSPQQNDWPTTRLARLDLEDGSIHPLGPDNMVVWDPQISPDGRWVAFKVYDHPAWEWSSQMHILPIKGGLARPLADTANRQPDLLGWSADGTRLYYLETWGTRLRLCALPVDGSSPEVLFEPNGCIENARLNQARNTLGFALQTLTEPLETYMLRLDDLSPRQVSRVNAEFQAIPVGRTEVIRWKSDDGLEIEGLLTYPPGYTGGKRCPLLVSVHGGPANAWMQFFLGMQSFFGPAATFAVRGYAILRVNVRGSTGYGKAFRRGNYRDWGGKDIQDLLSGVDHVISLGVADPQRMGIIGWSYGGYLAAATLTQTGRFCAAVIGAGMVNLVSYANGHDSPGFLPFHFGGEVWEVADLLFERSPIVHVDRVTTPTLILHGENDQRVPIWQGYEFYNALTRSGCPAQMVVYPHTGHTPTDPVLLLDVMDRTLAWMETYVSN
ncbi:MAG: S9 family peptidase [Anaerolineales bacterium]|jgi:dipeptidyl aminopeptidase/acylaminoacyl peptidase|nr:S9 family peptidase [Anaerolineales bacterium]